jgi:ankyrin repeat protein
VVKLLVDSGADLSLVDHWGYGATHMAVWSGNLEILKYLVGKNAPYNAKTKLSGSITVDDKTIKVAANATPLDIAIAMRDAAERDSTKSLYKDMVDYLKKLPPWKKK